MTVMMRMHQIRRLNPTPKGKVLIFTAIDPKGHRAMAYDVLSMNALDDKLIERFASVTCQIAVDEIIPKSKRIQSLAFSLPRGAPRAEIMNKVLIKNKFCEQAGFEEVNKNHKNRLQFVH